MTSPLVWWAAQAAHRTQWSHLLTLYQVIIKGCSKGYRWTAKWKRHSGQSVRRAGGASTCSPGVSSPGPPCAQQPGAPEACALGTAMGASSHRNGWLSAPLWAPLSGDWEMGLKILGFWGRLGVSVTSPNPEAHPGLKILGFWGWLGVSVTSPYPEAHPGHLIRAKDILIIQEIPRDFRALCQEQGQRSRRTKDAPFFNTLYILYIYIYIYERFSSTLHKEHNNTQRQRSWKT